MLKRPQVKKCLRIEIVEPDEVFLLGEYEQQAFVGRLHREIWPLLTGEYTSVELIEKLEGSIPFAEIIAFIGEMEQKGYLIEAGPTNIPIAEATFYHALGVDTGSALNRLGSTGVSVRALAGASEDLLVNSLRRAGVKVQAGGELEVVLTDDYLNENLKSINELYLSNQRPWMLATLSGSRIWLGPIFNGRGAPCWACLAQRLRANRLMTSYIVRKQGREDDIKWPSASHPSIHELGARILALEVAKYVVRPIPCSLSNHIITLDVLKLETNYHRVVVRPQCQVCGRADAWDHGEAVTLRSRRKHTSSEGERISCSADDALIRYAHHVSPITGAVTWLVETTTDSSGLSYTYSAGHSFPLIKDDLHWLIRNLRSNTGGKGTTKKQAQVSAMGEAFERLSISYHGDEPRLCRSIRAMGQLGVSLSSCLGFSEIQYANREAWNSRLEGTRLHVVPRQIDEDKEIEWLRAWSLLDERERWLPASFCLVGHPESRTNFFCSADSNGCAAGNSPEEAILRGFLELVERDAVAIWWYNRIRRPQVDPTFFCGNYYRALKARYAELDREIWVLDLTTDLAIPTFAAVSRKISGAAEDITLGCAAHLNPKTAMLRALSELNQFLPVFKYDVSGRGSYDFPDEEAINWWKTARSKDEEYLVPLDSWTNVANYADLETDDLLDDLKVCLQIARKASLEVVVLNQTRPEIDVPVWRVVVPGLRHFWRRLGPGRLYEVPVRLGWLDKATSEENMNPRSIFF